MTVRNQIHLIEKAKETKGVKKPLVDTKANELKRINFYMFQNPPIKRREHHKT